MITIGSFNFNYWMEWRIISTSASTGAAPNRKNNIMKSLQPTAAVIPGVLVATALLLSFRYPVSAETLFGYGTVVVLTAMLALEYRLNRKRLLTR
jgi:hypothetical protein